MWDKYSIIKRYKRRRIQKRIVNNIQEVVKETEEQKKRNGEKRREILKRQEN